MAHHFTLLRLNPYGSYSISDIQDYFEYIFKKHQQKAANPSIRIYINKIENRITFKIKTGYYLKLLAPEIMKLFGSTKSKITKNENGENVPCLEITKVVLIHCDVVNNSYQQNSKVLHTFVYNLVYNRILPKKFLFLKTFD